VLPILKKYQVPATLFLTSDLSPMETLAHLPRPSWDEVRALVASGLVDVQVHGRGHVSAYAFDPASEEFREQFLGCARDIAEEVGTQPILVAYPYGDKTRAHADVLCAIGFAAAFGTREGVVQEGVHPFALPRMSVERGMSRLLFMMRTCTRTVRAFSRMRK
jgi:peptidoglycan/xylan/chitin deacetylase (PgdA/CDA1 family)